MPRYGGNNYRGGYPGWGGGNEQQQHNWGEGGRSGGGNPSNRGQPQNSGGQHYSRGGTNTRQQGNGARWREVVQNDLQTERPIWVLSCYASERESDNDVADDLSPEEVRLANMHSSASLGAAPNQLAAEFEAARQAKLDQFKALMQARSLPSAGGPPLGAPRVSIAGLGPTPAPTTGLPFSTAASAPGLQTAAMSQPGPAFGQHAPQGFGQPASFQSQGAAGLGAAPASQQSSQQHGFGTAFGQTQGASKPIFGTAAAGTQSSATSAGGGGFGSTPFGGGSTGGGFGGAPFNSGPAGSPGVFGSAHNVGSSVPQGTAPNPFGGSHAGEANFSGGFGGAQSVQSLSSEGQTMLFGKQLASRQNTPVTSFAPPNQLGVPSASSVTLGANTTAATPATLDAAAATPPNQQGRKAASVWMVPDFARGGIPEEPPPQIFCQN